MPEADGALIYAAAAPLLAAGSHLFKVFSPYRVGLMSTYPLSFIYTLRHLLIKFVFQDLFIRSTVISFTNYGAIEIESIREDDF